jgi:UDP-N-acetylmuramate dehydrogenase
MPDSPADLGFPLQSNAPLSGLLSLGTGGPARWFCQARVLPELQAALDWAAQQPCALLVLGGGTNLVMADAGFDGLVIQMAFDGVQFEAKPGDTVHVTAGGGVQWDELVLRCCERGLSGVECLSGIPGTVGATPIQNVGAYGQEICQTLLSALCYDRHTRCSVQLSNSDCGFAYRDSRFKHQDRGRFVVLSVTFALHAHGRARVAYPELAARLEQLGIIEPTPSQLREVVLQLRADKSMLLNATDPNSRSCGSFFLNPILSAADYRALCERASPDAPPSFPQAGGRVKVPAAWLIQHAGFSRGYREGDVGLSTRHTLCVVAHPGATSSAVVAFAQRLRDAVAERFGVRLEPEPEFVGLAWRD